MSRFIFSALLLLALGAGAAQAQNRAPVQATRRNPTERISPMPGVVLPAGVGQANAEPVAAPTAVNPNGVLPLPKLPVGEVTVDSVQITTTPARRPATPKPKRRP